MATEKIQYDDMSSIAALQDTAQFDESNLPGLLKSLKAKTVGGQKFTEGTYELQDDVDGTGNVRLKKSVSQTNTAWINDVKTGISITHP